jgi:predicted PurR-regulated permease PerM
MQLYRERWVTVTVLAILACLLAYGVFLVMWPFFGEVFLAMVLAIVFYPVHADILRRTNRPTLAAWLTTLATGLLFLLPAAILSIVIAREAKHAVDLFSANIGPSGSFEWLDRITGFLNSRFGWDPAQTQEFLTSRMSGIGNSMMSNAVKSIQGVGSWLFSIAITLVTMFFLVRSGHDLLEQSKDWIPLPADMLDSLYSETKVLIFANVYGVLSVAAAQGLLTAMGLWFCGIPSPLFWGALAGVLSILPFVGAGLIWLPACIYLASTGDWTKAGILLGWGALIVSMADNVIRPMVVSEQSKTNTAIMFFALLGGIDAFGLIGIFAGPLVFSLAIAVLQMLRDQTQNTQIISTGSAP